ncbi:hypothetical protein ACO0LC_11430 [Undibacterium sp. JH2W]|uniref:hypothetical protein n=1 Tax=Undibacterium sp. JH2W TaxID=3413037 RepID=UPI003BEFF6E3
MGRPNIKCKDAQVVTLDLKQDLLTLAQMLAANQLPPPWQLGLSLSDFADSFDDDMAYIDAFRLWGMSAFDDAEYVQKLLDSTHAPEEWRSWAAEHFNFTLE